MSKGKKQKDNYEDHPPVDLSYASVVLLCEALQIAMDALRRLKAFDGVASSALAGINRRGEEAAEVEQARRRRPGGPERGD